MIEKEIDDYCFSRKSGRQYQGERCSFGQNLIQRMDPMPGKPVEFLNAVMNLVKFPQPWHRVK